MTEQDLSTNQAVVTQSSIPSSNVYKEDIGISLIDVLTQLALHKWLIVKVVGVAMLIGLILCFTLPVKYTATTKIMTPQQSASSANLINQLSSPGTGSLAVLAGGGLGGLKDPNGLYIGLLTSRPVADAIIHKFSLDQVYHSKNMDDARKKLTKNTAILSEKSGFIAVTVTDKDKKRVAGIANEYTVELHNRMKTLAITEASQRRLFYEEQLKQAKDTLAAAELSFQKVQQQKGLVQLDAQAKTMIESIAELRAKAAAKEVEVTALRSYSTEQNPGLQLAESELSTLQGEISQMEQRNHSAGVSDIGLADIPSAELEYLRAEHELKYRQALFDLLIKQYDAARLDEAKEAAVIQVVEPAIEQDRKTSPRRGLIMLISTVIGMLCGCIVSLLQVLKKKLESDPKSIIQVRELKRAFSVRRQTQAANL
jgi:uncharacterized protein involved in exopolysaccharide biosynthesis